MAKFEVEFRDGQKVVKDANTADDAKRSAKKDRVKDLPPDTPKSAPEMMVTKVARLE